MFVTSNSTASYARRQAGGKGYNLYLLSRAGFPVPRWAVLGADLFKRFKTQSGIAAKLQHIATGTDNNQQKAAAIAALIYAAPLPAEIADEAHRAYAYLDCSAIAVRSSAVGEDSAQHSFAGQLDSFLFVESAQKAIEKLKACWASAFSARSLSYRLHNNLGQK